MSADSKANQQTESPLRCSFCGVQKTASVPLIAGNEGHICEQCVKLAHQVVTSWGRKAAIAKPELKSPSVIKRHLDEYIIGQDGAKKTLSVALYNHYLRMGNQEDTQLFSHCSNEAVEVEKSNVLMTGPSGAGKTLLVKTMAKIIGVPFVIGDATTLTQAGYVGQDVESLLKRLLEAADWDVQQAQWGIIYIDEIDKIARRGDGGTAIRDIGGEGVQQALLKMIEGAEVRVPKGGPRDSHGEEVMLNTQNILFIVGGAFPGLVELIGKRLHPVNTSIGFHAPLEKDHEYSNDELLNGLKPEDLQRFGLIPEFIGRFPIVTFLQDLDVEALKRILVEPKNALVKQFKQLFAYQRIGLDFSEEAITAIAEQAVERGTGARGLRAIMETLLLETMFELPELPNLVRCIVKVQREPGEQCESKLVVEKIYQQNQIASPQVQHASVAS